VSSRRTRAHDAMRRLLERGRAQVRGAFEETLAQRAYRGAFEAEASEPPAEPLDLEACAARVGSAPAILLGTFHTCPEVPRGMARLVAHLPAAPGGEVWLLPFVRAERDELLDDYAQGWDSEEFLEELDDLDPWPFERWAYKPLLEAARARGARLLGVGDLPAGSPPMARAEADAARLAEHAREGVRLVALVGEHHLALEHLPTRLAAR